MPIELNTSAAPAATVQRRDVWAAMLAGWRCRCPACNRGRLFRAFLKVADTCPDCSEALHHQRADDAPAYFTMVIVGHIVVGGVLVLEKAKHPETWVHLVIWLPLMTAMTLFLLPRIKGALVGLQWALRMHGFGGIPDAPEPEPDPSAAVAEQEKRR